MQQLHWQVEGQVDAVVCSLIEAVVPSLNIVVGSDGQHVNRPAGRRLHCASSLGVSCVLDKFPKSGGSGTVTEMLEHGRDVSFW